MTDVKRKFAEDESAGGDDGHLNKRVALDSLTEEGPLTQGDVIYFQKEAIWRQMNLYKRQYEFLKSQIESYRDDASKDAKKVQVLLSWYRQVLANFDVPNDVETDENLLNKAEAAEDDAELSALRDSFVKVLTSLKAGSGDDKNVLKIAQLTEDLKAQSHAKNALTKETKSLQGRVVSLQDEILALTQRLERANSQTLKRINGTQQEEEVTVKQETANGVEEAKEDVVNNEEYEKMTTRLNELQDLNANLLKQINEEVSSSSNLKKELTSVTLKLTNLKEEDLANCEQYQGLKVENDKLNQEVEDLRLKAKQYFTRITELESEKAKFQSEKAEELMKEKNEAVASLEKAEQDLVRIRSIRDDLMSKNSVLKNEKAYKVVVEELKSLVELQRKRIEELTSTRENGHAELEAGSTASSELDKEALAGQNALLVRELKEVEAAFKEAHELSIKKLLEASESASLVNKLNVEKSKADQKYFSTMRVNDALTAESKISKVTISKQQELVNSMKEVEKKLQAKVEVLESKLKDMKFLENNLVSENQQFKKRIAELTKKIEFLQGQNAKLSAISEKITSERDSELSWRRQKENEVVKLASKLKSVEALNAKYKSNLTGTVLQEDQEQISALRAMVKCSVCSKNWKDTVIKNCGHVFCSDCAQERLAARLRRCPSCNKQFSSNDLLNIHL